MHLRKGHCVFTLCSVLSGCGIDTEPPPVGDVGDTSASELKVTCNLARDAILSSAKGERRTAIERGFAWFDAQVPYSQSQYHEGFRTDCSGFVSMCWQLETSYSTREFINDTDQWTSLGSFSELVPADAMVRRQDDSGHIVLFVGWNDAAKTQACVIEQASTALDMQFRARSLASLEASGYHAIRAVKFNEGEGSACYCDAQCTGLGDCCADCFQKGTKEPPACYCDDVCVANGDCCTNCG